MPEYQAVVCSERETKEMELYIGPFPEARLLSRDGRYVVNVRKMKLVMITSLDSAMSSSGSDSILILSIA